MKQTGTLLLAGLAALLLTHAAGGGDILQATDARSPSTAARTRAKRRGPMC
jgi:hypothetical protein